MQQEKYKTNEALIRFLTIPRTVSISNKRLNTDDFSLPENSVYNPEENISH